MPLAGTSDYKRKWQGEKSCIWFNLGYLKWHLSYSQRVGIYVADPSIQEQEKTNITHLYTLFSVMNSTHWYAPGPVAGSTLLIYGSIVILGWKTVKQPLFSLEKMQTMPTVPDWTERGRGFFTWSHVSIHSLGSTSIAEQSEYKSTHPVLMLAVPWRQSLLSGGEQAVCSEANQGPPHHIKDKIVRFSQR